MQVEPMHNFQLSSSSQEPFQQVPKEEACFGPSSGFSWCFSIARYPLHIDHHCLSNFLA